MRIPCLKESDERNLRNMRWFYQASPKMERMRSELNRTHYQLLLHVEDDAARQWYMNETVGQGWNTRALERQIGTLYYESLLASKDRKSGRDEAGQNLSEIEPTPREFVRKRMLEASAGIRKPRKGGFQEICAK